MQINPWETTTVDYDKVFREFGIKEFSKLDPELEAFPLFRRGLIFGHRDFDKWWSDYKQGKTVSILTGMMPSGPFHLGHKIVVDQLVFYQNLGIPITLTIADVEARTVRKKTGEEIKEIATNYLLNYAALGLNLDEVDIYLQTNRSIPYNRLAQLVSGKVTFAEMTAIYGELSPGKIMSAMYQVSDILHKELLEYLGKHRVLVPVGIDQDPHLRLSRDIAERIGFIKPASTYHKFIRGLDSDKMSSSRPNSYISLDEPTDQVMYKVKNALTGGRNTLTEQKELGGEPDKCRIYELYLYHFEKDDDKLEERRKACLSGELVCGDCKKELLKRMDTWLSNVHEKKEKMRHKVESLVEEKVNYPF